MIGLIWSGTARAQFGTVDSTPGATMLYPYFEVDLDDPAGSNTIISLRSATATAILGNVVVWSDTGYPVLNFPVYLTGYDVVTFDMREMVVNGNLPRTASAGQDPADTISNKGPESQDINFASCSGILPWTNPVLFQSTIVYLQSALTGKPSAETGGRCAGFNHGDDVARGYITIDVVNHCTTQTPGTPGYFISGGSGSSTNQNTMTGEYLLRVGDRVLHTANAVGLEANSMAVVPGDYTFHGRQVAWTAADNREPLNGAWAVDTQATDTELIVWRDVKIANQTFSCGASLPSGLPLGQEGLVHFDRRTGFTSPAVSSAFPLATQRVRLSDVGGTQATAGWSYLNLNTNVAPAGANPPVDPLAAGAYVEVVQYPEVSGQGAGSGVALPLDGGNSALHSPTPP